jgi:hypothetical protein
LPETQLDGYPEDVTTAGSFRTTASRMACDVSVAGVPWPAYKLAALLLGLVVALVVGLVTLSAAPAVLAGAAIGTVAWVGLSAYCSTCR